MKSRICSSIVTVFLTALVTPATANKFTDAVANSLARTFSYENLLRHKVECAFICFIILYFILAILGTLKNKQVASVWLRFLGAEDSVLARNFSVHGGIDGSASKEELCWKESADTYKCYVSGRRYCSGALLTLKLKARQDLFQQLWSLVSPAADELEVEVFMSESVMPQTVMLLGQPKVIKALLRDNAAYGNYAKLLQVSKERVAGGWSNDKVTVAAEHAAMFYDLLNTDAALSRALHLKWLKCVVISSESPPEADPPGPRLKLKITLPPELQAEDVNTLLSCAFMLVDLVGSYKVSSEMKKKATDLRQKIQQEEAKKGSEDRQELLQQKRMEKLEAERAKARAAGPAALAKFEEKLQTRMRQKELRKRTMRM